MAGAIGTIIGSAIAAKIQSDAAKKQARVAGEIGTSIEELQRRQFEQISLPLARRGMRAFDRATQSANFNPFVRTREDLRSVFRLLNADLALTGNERAGSSGFLKGQLALKTLRGNQDRLFSNNLQLAQLGTQQGVTAAGNANDLFNSRLNAAELQAFGNRSAAGHQAEGLFGGINSGLQGLALSGLFNRQQQPAAQGAPGTSINAIEQRFGRR